MTGYIGSIEEIALRNTYFRQVLFTAKHAQLVVMCLQPGEEIGDEVHDEASISSSASSVARRNSSSTRKEERLRARRRRNRGAGGDLPQRDQRIEDGRF